MLPLSRPPRAAALRSSAFWPCENRNGRSFQLVQRPQPNFAERRLQFYLAFKLFALKVCGLARSARLRFSCAIG